MPGAAGPGPGTIADPDQALVARLRLREEAAFVEIVGRYNPSLTRVATRRLGDAEAAEECVQETWIALLNGIDAFEGRSSLRTWLFRILANITATRRQRDARREQSFSDLAGLEAGHEERSVDPSRFHGRLPFVRDMWRTKPTEWGRSPEELAEAGETRDAILGAVAALPPAQQEVIRLHDIEGWSSEEVCELLGLSAGNQRVLLHRARSKVRRALELQLT